MPEVEDVYREIAPDLQDSFTFVTQTQVLEKTAPEERMVLTSSSHTKIAMVTGVPELSGEIERAVWQVQRSLQEQRDKLASEKQIAAPVDSSTQGSSEKDSKQ